MAKVDILPTTSTNAMPSALHFGIEAMPSSATSSNNIEIASVRAVRLRMSELTSETVARGIVEFCAEHGDLITNLRLQRLLYYVQAWHLALHDAPLFPEDFEAWPSGPVEPRVNARLSEFDNRPIDLSRANVQMPKKLMSHIRDVMEAYGSLSSFDLARLSQDEEPWKAAMVGNKECGIIRKDLMQGYYKLKLPNGKKT